MNSIATPCPSIPSEISAILRSRFDLTADVQVIPVKGEGRTLYHLELILWIEEQGRGRTTAV